MFPHSRSSSLIKKSKLKKRLRRVKAHESKKLTLQKKREKKRDYTTFAK